MTPERTFAIVGASLAGAKAAETLRAEGFDGRVLLVGSETERPYERPPLSKEYLRGEAEREKIYVHEEGYYGEHEIELRLGRTAAGLDVAARELTLDDGEPVRYDSLLLATGAEPRRLDVPGADLDGVRYLRSVTNSDALRERFERARSVVVVGGGWIGCEVAAAARQHGLDVTLVEPLQVPLQRVLGDELGGFYRDVHAEHGVQVLTGVGVEALEGGDAVERVVLADGRRIDCELVVVGVGVRPRTQLAGQAGLAVDDGILVDERLESSAPGVFAAGDVARARHPFYDASVRVEHWATALNQGPAAARSMLGGTEPYDRLPYFYSDQYDVGMEYTGWAPEWDRVVFRGDPASREFIAFWLRGDRVLAGMNVNVWDVADSIEQLIREGAPVDVERLVDAERPLVETG
jgi:3-phenylpropionate/trans-cinnamate dioxygenase ferredoxin reductase subunit